MNMQESSRLILGLRAKGWTDTEITDFILWIETGEEQYKPKDTIFLSFSPRICYNQGTIPPGYPGGNNGGAHHKKPLAGWKYPGQRFFKK